MRRMIEEVDTEAETSFLAHEAPWENKGKFKKWKKNKYSNYSTNLEFRTR